MPEDGMAVIEHFLKADLRVDQILTFSVQPDAALQA
jgi:hypothetical protein